MARRWRSSFAVVAAASVPGITYLLMLGAQRALPDDRVWADYLLQVLLLVAAIAPVATPVATLFLIRRWHRPGAAKRWIGVTLCAVAWVGTVRLLTALVAMESLY
jgi:hypothetical protein